MYAISLRQPSVDAIFSGHKTVEISRRRLRHRGDLVIHCSRAYGPDERERLAALRARGIDLGDPSPDAFGALVGTVRLAACRPVTVRDWEMALVPPVDEDRGHWAWELAEADRFPEPIPYRGRLYLFEIPDQELARAVAAAR